MILFVDLDGTLWEHETLDVPAAQAIKQARAAGHLVYLCTGRSAGQLPEPVVAIGWDGMITNGGGAARVGSRVIAEQVMTRAQVDYLTSLFAANNIPYLLETDNGVFGSPEIIEMYDGYIRSRRAAQNAELVARGEKPEPVPATTEASKFMPIAQANPDHIAKICFFSDDPNMYAEMFELLHNDFFLVPSSIPMPGGSTGEIAPLGVSKGTAIKAVLAELGLDQSQAVGIGDSHNDLEMFDACGTAVAMGNAVPELLAQADFITTAVLDGGVKAALHQLKLIP